MNICCCAGSVLPHVCVSVPPGSPAPVGVPVFYCSLCESFFRVCFMFITLISTISYLLEICQLQVTIQLLPLLESSLPTAVRRVFMYSEPLQRQAAMVVTP